MKCVLGLVFLLCTLGTSLGKMDLIANADKLSDLRAEFLLIDLWPTNKVNARAVLKAFQPVDDLIVYQTKFYGESRYLFVLYNDHSQALKDFSLPLDLQVPASFTPVQTLYTYIKHFDEKTPYPPANFTKTLSGELTYVERTVDLKGFTFELMAALLTSLGIAVQNLCAPHQIFVEGAGLPMTLHFFSSGFDDYDIAELMVKHTVNLYGGPGKVFMNTGKIAFI